MRNAMGRSSEYKAEVAETICERLMEGESLRKICSDPDMPDRNTVFRWLSANEDFHRQYARAREIQADTLFEETLEISDDDSLDIGFDDEGKPFIKGENIQRARLRVDTRKWMAGKLKPKVYGDKTTVAGDPDSPVRVEGKLDVTLSPDEAYLRMLNAKS